MTAGGLAVAFHFDGTLIILIKNGGLDWVPLGLHEHFYIEGVGEVITGTNELSFSGALTVEVLIFQIDFTQEVNCPTSEMQADKIFHMGMQVCSSDVGSGHVVIFISVNHDD